MVQKVRKVPGAVVVTSYNGLLYLGKILEFDDETVKVSTM